MIFRTQSKDKIGKNLSYPIGAELIGKAVGDIPQAAQVGLHFRSQTTTWASQWKEILNNNTRYVVFSCSISWEDRAVAWDGLNIQGGSWDIDIYPVLREHRAVVRQELLAFGLPDLREYLWRTTTDEGRRKGTYFGISFDLIEPIEKQLLVNGQSKTQLQSSTR